MITTLNFNNNIIMMIQTQLLSLVWLVVSLQHGASGFFLAPNTRAGGAAPATKDVSLLFASSSSQQKPSGYKSFSSSFPINEQDVQEDESSASSSSSIRENDLSMFLAQVDESIQRLKEVEEYFRKEPFGIMMEEQTGVVPIPLNKSKIRFDQKKEHNHKHIAIPIPSDKIKLAKDTSGIGIDEELVSKKVVQYEYDGTLSKIKRNMCNMPVNYYTE